MPSGAFGQSLAVPVGPDDHVRGAGSAPITVVEYGHYQSAECSALQPFLQELLRERAPRIRWVYRHFPLPPEDLHPYKQLAAEFAEAAAARDRFWGVHDWLFEHYYDIDRSFLHRTELMFDLPPEAVGAEMSAGLYRDRVIRDHTGGLGSGVVQAPTLFVNGRRLDTGPTPAEVMAELVPTLDRSAS